MMKAVSGIVAMGLLASGGAAVAQGGGGAADAAKNWQAVLACAQQPSTAARHDCVDQVLRNAGALNPAQEAQQQRQDFGRTARATRPAAPPPPPASAPAQAPAPAQAQAQAQAQAPSPAPAPLDAITGTVAAARIGADGKLLIATTDATVWRQVDGETFRIAPSSGAAFQVERGALGSLMCKVGNSGSYRCIRVD